MYKICSSKEWPSVYCFYVNVRTSSEIYNSTRILISSLKTVILLIFTDA